MATYTLKVDFDNKQLETLSKAKYNVCISKLVNDQYTVVWLGQTVSNSNIFQWTEEYEVFGAAEFTEGLLVKAQTNAVPIAFGQTATVDGSGVMGPAVGPHTGGTFTVENNWMPVHIGLKQKIGNSFQTIYVDPTETVLGAEDFTPINTVIVFLSKSFSTGTMFTKARSAVITVSFSGDTTQTVSYITDPQSPGPGGLSGIWINGQTPVTSSAFAATAEGKQALSLAVASGRLSAVIPQRYSHARGFEPLPHAYDAFKIAELVNFFLHDFKRAEPEKPKKPENAEKPERSHVKHVHA